MGIAIFFSSLTFASPTSDSAFFKIHQATGFFEQFISGDCPIGKKRAESLLKSVNRDENETSLNEKALQLRSIVGNKKPPPVTDVEKFRLSIHELMEQQGLHHEQRWHDQIVDECKTTKH